MDCGIGFVGLTTEEALDEALDVEADDDAVVVAGDGDLVVRAAVDAVEVDEN